MMALGTLADVVLQTRSKNKFAVGEKMTPKKTISKKVGKGKKQKDPSADEDPKNA